MKKWLLFGLLTPIFLIGCEPEVKAGFSAQQLQQSWVLTKIDGKDINIEEPITIPGMAIDADLKVSGFSGCNQFFGQVEVSEGNRFRVTAMGSTKMACIQDDLAELESLMSKSLQKWNNVALENNILTLTSEQHILTFMPQGTVEPESPQ
ncbi:META domain-containing protein [Photobacterium sp. SDRW27]|uniref:META domain-containing protein n=1 Tax=Photobacterium obscurum TaxID=2829490 RepID=UPI002244CD29|nr:META domain-containing protein [Photobacterium obscurum]MCW8328513.1 META domain-containing protein [Photobacterium obscurum]